MADNVTADAGSGGAVFRTDDDGTAHWPYTKIAFGADNTQTIVGSISSNPLPVALSATDNAVLDTINTAAVAVQAAVEGTLTVGSHAVTNAGTFATQATLQAGTAEIGKLAAGTASIGDIGTVTAVTDITNPITANPASGTIDTVTNLSQMGGVAISLNTGARDTGTQRVTVATDDLVPVTGTITAVTDITNTVTVDGTGTLAVQAAVDNAHSADFDSGAGTDTTTAFGIAVPASGGAAVVPGDATAGLKVDLGSDNDVTLATLPDTAASDLASMSADLGTIDTDTGTIAAGFAAEGSALGSGVLLQGDDGTDRTNVLVDAAGHLQVDVLTGGGAGTQYTLGTDTYTETTTVSTVVGAVRNDGGGSLVGTDNEIAPLQVNSAGCLINHDGTLDSRLATWAYTEDSADPGTKNGLGITLLRKDTPATLTSTDGDSMMLRGTNYGAAFVQILDSSGSFIDSFAGPTEYTEDVAAAANPVGSALMLVREDARAGSLTTTDGDNVAARGNNKGELYTIDTDGNALLTTIDADTSTIAGAVSGSEMQVDVVSGTVTTVSTVSAITAGSSTNAAVATNGCNFFKSIDLDESEEEVKATAGTLYGGLVMNLTASVLYFKVYNATAASVTVGTTVPDLTIPIPTAGSTNGAGFVIPMPACGVAFGTAISVAVTTAIADNDAGAPAANACAVALFYE